MKLWVARDKNLYAFDGKPYLVRTDKCGPFWISHNGHMGNLIKDTFPEITFENSPQQIEINLIK